MQCAIVLCKRTKLLRTVPQPMTARLNALPLIRQFVHELFDSGVLGLCFLCALCFLCLLCPPARLFAQQLFDLCAVV